MLGLATAAAFALDSPVYHFLHAHYNEHTRPVPELLKVTTRILRSAEDWGENVFILGIAFAIWRLDVTRRGRLIPLALSAILVTGIVEIAKRLVGRERPEVSHGALRFHGLSWGDMDGDRHSFPSGHTASAAAYSGTLATCYPPLRPVFVALAVGCGANRIWKERHFLSDVWVGGLLGYWLGSSLPRRRWLRSLGAHFDRRFSRPITSPAAPPPRRLAA